MDIQVLALPELIPVIITLISVFILYLILNKFLYTPVVGFLEKRKSNIQDDIDKSKELKAEAEKLKLDYESRIDMAEKERQEILESARKRGDELKEEIIQEARKEGEAIVERARRDIEREREVAFQDIRSQVGELSILMASKIMEEELSEKKQGKLIDKFIDEVGNSQWLN